MMTAEDARRPTVGELADLDAGLVDGREVDEASAARLRAEAARDPRSREVLDALAATRAELAAAPLPDAPPADRWAALFAEPDVHDVHDAREADVREAEPEPAPVVPLRRRSRGRPALVAAAALVAIAIVAGVVARPATPQVSRPQLLAAVQEARGVFDAGDLGDPARRATCLRATAPGVAPDAQLLGARRVDYEGSPGVLLVLGTGELGRFAVVVVDPGCDRALANVTVP